MMDKIHGVELAANTTTERTENVARTTENLTNSVDQIRERLARLEQKTEGMDKAADTSVELVAQLREIHAIIQKLTSSIDANAAELKLLRERTRLVELRLALPPAKSANPNQVKE